MVNYRTPLVSPSRTAHTATVIFLHGLGDSGNGWSFAVENWRRRNRLDHVKFILPHAPEVPVTVNGGMRMPAWYDVIAMGGGTLTLRRNEDETGIVRSRDYLVGLVQGEIDAGIPSERIVIGGFSQGGAISIFTGMTSAIKLAGIIAMSTYAPLSAKLDRLMVAPPAVAANIDTPFMMYHGSADQIVPMALGKLSRDLLGERGFKKVHWEEYPDLPHSACPEELDAVQEFLETTLPVVVVETKTGKTEL